MPPVEVRSAPGQVAAQSLDGWQGQGQAGWAHVAHCRLSGGGTADVAIGWSRDPHSPAWSGGEVGGVIGPAGNWRTSVQGVDADTKSGNADRYAKELTELKLHEQIETLGEVTGNSIEVPGLGAVRLGHERVIVKKNNVLARAESERLEQLLGPSEDRQRPMN